MQEKIEINAQSSIKIKGNKYNIYIDPYLINNNINDADFIFITHEHYDHLSYEDIIKVINDKTILIIPESCYPKLTEFGLTNEIVQVKPNTKYSLLDITFQTVAAYNTNKLYHTISNNWVGYLIELDQTKYFITGDTDITKENKVIKCDVLLIAIGGTYTMDYQEAATLTNLIKPKLAIPTHYQTIVGTKQDAINYTELVDKKITTKILY